MMMITDDTQISEVRQWLSIAEGDRRKLIELQDLARKARRPELQLEITTKLVVDHPGDLGSLHVHTIALLANDRIEQALRISELGMELSADNLRSLNNRFETLFVAGLYDEAEHIANRMIELFPDKINSYSAQMRLSHKRLDPVRFRNFADMAVEKLDDLAAVQAEDVARQYGRISVLEDHLCSCVNMKQLKHLIFLASGGMTHMLSCLGASVLFAKLADCKCVPVTRVNRNFQIDFYDIFEVIENDNNPLVINEERDTILQTYGLDSRYSSVYTRPLTADDGKVHYVLGENENPFSLAFPREISSPYIEISGFDQKFWSVEDKLEQALKSIRLRETVRSEIAKWHESLLCNSIIGVHFRNTDYRHDIAKLFDATDRHLDAGDIDWIYFATDDPAGLELARQRYAGRCGVLNFSSQVSSTEFSAPNVHSIPDQSLRKVGLTKKRILQDFFIDVAMLASSRVFIPSGSSSVGSLVRLLRRRRDLYESFFGFLPA